MSSINAKNDRLSFGSLQIIKPVIILFSEKHIKIMSIALFFILIFGVIAYFAGAVNRHISSAQILYDAFFNTVQYISENIKSDVPNPCSSSDSFDLTIVPSEQTDSFFSEVDFVKNNQAQNISISINKFKLNNKYEMDIKAFADNQNISVSLNNNPQLCYSADANNFKYNWNNSVYSCFFTMPSFVPDSVNYNEINKLLTSENLPGIFAALSFENMNIDKKELINNIDIKHKEDYPIYYDGNLKKSQLIKLSISGDYVKRVFARISKAASGSVLKKMTSSLCAIEDYFDNMKDRVVDVNFVLYDGIIRSAETSFKTKENIRNISLSISGSEILLVAKELFSHKGDDTDFESAIKSDNINGLSMYAVSNGTKLMNFNMKNIQNTLHSDLTYLDSNNNFRTYRFTMSDKVKKQTACPGGRNIYTLSFSDLYSLYNSINN